MGVHERMMDINEISRMTQDEKLRLLEALCENLSRENAKIASPYWHEAELKETSREFESNEEKVMDWEDAKRMLRNRFEGFFEFSKRPPRIFTAAENSTNTKIGVLGRISLLRCFLKSNRFESTQESIRSFMGSTGYCPNGFRMPSITPSTIL